MKLNRVLSTLVLTGLLSGATMVAQAQTHIFFGFGGGRAPVVSAQYYSPGPGYIWVAGYYNGPYWVPGYWARRADDDGYYGRGYYGNSYYGGYYRGGDEDHNWRREDDGHDRGWRGGDHRDNGWHRGWRGDDHHDH